jgi:hypothetical protein
MFGPKLTACILTPMTQRITPRLYIHCGHIEDGFWFGSLQQWFRLFYNGSLSERSLADVETSFGTGTPNQAQFVLTWYRYEDDIYSRDKRAASRVLHGLHKEAAILADDPDPHIDVSKHVYQWLVNNTPPAIREGLLPETRANICRSIGPYSRGLGYKDAMEK